MAAGMGTGRGYCRLRSGKQRWSGWRIQQFHCFDAVRLAQDVEATLQSGQSYYYEFGQVVVPEVTIPALTKSIPQLMEEGYLERHLPLREPAANKTLHPA